MINGQPNKEFLDETVACWLAHLPHTSRAGGLIPTSAMCVDCLLDSSWYSGFLPNSKCGLSGIKLSVVHVNRCVIHWHPV